MHFGLEIVPFGPYSDPRAVVELALAAEEAGWEGIWLWDHVVFPYGVGDPWITFAAIATVTKRLKLISGVSPVPRYQPQLLARTLTSLDILSQGRVIFGAGLGVDFDFAPFGAATDVKTRAAMTDEGLELLMRLLSGEEVTHHGRYFGAESVRLTPSPLQQPAIPVWIGGDSNAALQRAAAWNGWIMGTIDEQRTVTKPPTAIAAQVQTIHRHRRARGAADDSAFDIAVDGTTADPGDNALVAEYAAAGATWWFECIFASRGSHEEMLQRIAAGPPRFG